MAMCPGHRDDHDSRPAAAGVARRGERAVGQHLDRRRAAEEQVAAPPADDVVPELLEPVELGRVVPALAVDVRLVDVDARRADRVLDAEAVLEDVDDDLHDRAAQPRRAGAADDEPRRPPSASGRSRAPSCSSAAGRAAPGGPRPGRTRRACCSGRSRCPARSRPSPIRSRSRARPRCRPRRSRRRASSRRAAPAPARPAGAPRSAAGRPAARLGRAAALQARRDGGRA